MNPHLKSADVAKQFGVSQRQARRMIVKNDPRLNPMTRSELLRISASRYSKECFDTAEDISRLNISLKISLNIETLQDGPEVERLRKLADGLTRTASAFRTLGCDFSKE